MSKWPHTGCNYPPPLISKTFLLLPLSIITAWPAIKWWGCWIQSQPSQGKGRLHPGPIVHSLQFGGPSCHQIEHKHLTKSQHTYTNWGPDVLTAPPPRVHSAHISAVALPCLCLSFNITPRKNILKGRRFSSLFFFHRGQEQIRERGQGWYMETDRWQSGWQREGERSGGGEEGQGIVCPRGSAEGCSCRGATEGLEMERTLLRAPPKVG